MANLYTYTPIVDDEVSPARILMKRDDKYGTYVSKYELEEWLEQQYYNFVSPEEIVKTLCEELGINYG